MVLGGFPPSLTTIGGPESTAEHILGDMKAVVIDDTPLAVTVRKQRGSLALPPNFDKITPMAKKASLQALGADVTTIELFLEGKAKLNIIRSIHRSIRSVASGIRNYIEFRHLIDASPFPVLRNTIRRWSGAFGPRKTSGLYPNHALKDCVMLGCPSEWINPRPTNACKGTSGRSGPQFRLAEFHSAWRFNPNTELRWGRFGIRGGIVLPFLFSLRSHSEARFLRMAGDAEQPPRFTRQGEKALIGTRPVEHTEILVIKSRFRKNIRGGCILLRPCLCFESNHMGGGRGAPLSRNRNGVGDVILKFRFVAKIFFTRAHITF